MVLVDASVLSLVPVVFTERHFRSMQSVPLVSLGVFFYHLLHSIVIYRLIKQLRILLKDSKPHCLSFELGLCVRIAVYVFV